MVGPSVVGEVGLDWPAEHDRLEIVHPGFLPARLQIRRERGVGGAVATNPDRRRGALEHVHVLGRLGERRQALQPACPGPDQGDDLVAEIGERFAGPAPGEAVVPPRGVERAAGEVVHPRNGRQFHEIEDSDSQYVETAGQFVAPIGVDLPAAGIVVPHGFRDAGVEQGVGNQVEPVCDRLQMQAYFLAEGVAPAGDVVEFLKHGQVLIRLDVAHHAGIPVPVPGAPDAPGLVDDPDALDARLAQMRTRENSGDTTADDDHVGVVDDRLALGVRGEGIGPVAGRVLISGQIADGGAAWNEALVALREVLRMHGVGVEGHGSPFRQQSCLCYKLCDECKTICRSDDVGAGIRGCVARALVADGPMRRIVTLAVDEMVNPLASSIFDASRQTSTTYGPLPAATDWDPFVRGSTRKTPLLHAISTVLGVPGRGR